MSFELSPNAIKGIISALIAIVVYIFVIVIEKIITKKVANLKRRHTARKTTLYIGTLIAIIAISALWAQNLKTFTVVISVIGAGLMVALGDVFLSIAGWFLILIRRPFEPGDRVQIGEVKGDVIDIRLFQTSLLEIGNWVNEDQSTGRVVHISNSTLFKAPVFNYTRGFEFLWDEIKMVVTFKSDWRKAEAIMLSHARKEAERLSEEMARLIKKMAERYFIFYDKLTPIVYVKVVENGIELSLRYLTEVKKRRFSFDNLNRLILDDFDKESNVNFAYPTYRLVK
ncbi:MAG: mechanosensitive ion channel family protein [Candidatus Omnitrophota bacterium]